MYKWNYHRKKCTAQQKFYRVFYFLMIEDFSTAVTIANFYLNVCRIKKPHDNMIFDNVREKLQKITTVNLSILHQQNVFDDITTC